MPPFRVVSSPLAGDLLRRALAHRGLPPDAVTWLPAPGPDRADGTADPAAVCLQLGGLHALQQMGLDVSALVARGTVMTGLRVLHPQGHRSVRLDLEPLSSVHPLLFIATPLLKHVLASAAPEDRGTARRDEPAADAPPASPAPRACPDILQRVFRGRLRHPEELLLWDHPRGYLGVGQLPDDRVVCYASPMLTVPPAHQREACAVLMREAVERLRHGLVSVEALTDERWFHAQTAGARPAWAGGTLWWGERALTLHPITGMSISYWAIQANRLAEELRRHGQLSHRFVHALDASNRHMVRRNRLSVSFHLRLMWVRRFGYWPAVRLLARWTGLRHAVLRRLWLC